jgi:AraC-like DNA-binding protein
MQSWQLLILFWRSSWCERSMRPYLERLPLDPDASWSMLNRRLEAEIPFLWHHHPEFELTLTLNSAGQRFIGDSVESYEHGDLVLVGPDLPHTWASREKVDVRQPHIALVFWFRADWLASITAGSVELAGVRAMMARAASGLAFDPATGLDLREECEAMFVRPPAQRLIGLLAILERLAREPAPRPLASRIPALGDASRSRIDRVLLHLHQHYAEPVPLEDLAAIAALSVSGLHRTFFKQTRSTVSDYLTGLRIGDACARLSGTRQPIGHIAAEVGYPSLANFNRQFRRLRGMTPRAYRASFRS